MASDLSNVKIVRSRTQPTQQVQRPYGQSSDHFINPVIKHTFQSLPAIYGSHPNRKKKYNIFMKNKFQLNSLISKSNAKSLHSHERSLDGLNQADQQRQRGQSCLQLNKHRQPDNKQREQIAKTVMKQNKNTQKSPDQLSTKGQNKSQFSATPQSKKLLNLQLLNNLSKPRQNCNKQYCSCKSLFKQYKEEIKKKLKEKKQNNASRRQISSRIQLPRLSVELNKLSSPKLDDQESKHKVNFRHSQRPENEENEQCTMCNKMKLPDKLELKGLLGLIHKKQLEDKRKKLTVQSNTQNIGIQSDMEYMGQSQIQDFGIQADLTTTKKKLATIDQQINTEAEDQNKDYKYLQNNKNSKQSPTKQKKQPLQHLSHLKEKYKYKKKPTYQSKYDQNSDDDQNCEQHNNNQDQNNPNRKHRKSQMKKGKKGKPLENQDEFQINMETESVMSEKSLINHLTKALGTGRNDKSTIFKALKKKQAEESQNDLGRSSSKNKAQQKSKKKHKNMNLIDADTGLFAIPEEQQYVDYLKSYKPISKDFKIKSLIKSQNFKILKYNDTLYFGQTDAENKKHGKALFISPKQIFEGVYQNGIKMSGCERNIDGVYIGQFLNGQRHGNGKWLWNNGQVYEGQWRLGTKNGHGIWKSPKGDSYQGQWLLNRQQGKGIHRHKSSVYEGQFVQSLKQGKGKQKFINGDQYVGQYLRGKPHGKGRYTWKNGNYYQGQFKNGLRQGFGRWYFSQKEYYEGHFKGDFKHGYGKQYFENGDIYEGQYSQGVKTKGYTVEGSTKKVTELKNSSNTQSTETKQKEKQKQETNIESFLKDSKVIRKQKKTLPQDQQASAEKKKNQKIIEDNKNQVEEQKEEQDEIKVELKSQVQNEK